MLLHVLHLFISRYLSIYLSVCLSVYLSVYHAKKNTPLIHMLLSQTQGIPSTPASFAPANADHGRMVRTRSKPSRH